MKKQKTSTNKGFSMIELIIVIAIMAILIAVLAPVYTRYLERARVSDDTTLADHLKTAVETSLVDPDITNPTGTAFAINASGTAGTDTITPGEFWDNVSAIMGYSSTADMLNHVDAGGDPDDLFSELRSTGATTLNITINGDGAEVELLDGSGVSILLVD